MAKYRTLTTEELNTFEKEFISFLVVNGIEATEWEKIKADSVDKTAGIIDQFSDVIFESVFRKSRYLDHISAKSIKCFQFLENEIVLVSLSADNESNVDFLSNTPMSEVIKTNLEDLAVYQTKKGFADQREIEMFEMTNKGATISDGSLFKQICLLL